MSKNQLECPIYENPHSASLLIKQLDNMMSSVVRLKDAGRIDEAEGMMRSKCLYFNYVICLLLQQFA